MLLKARVAKCYGWTDKYIMECDYETIIEYYEAITVIDAESRMVDLSVSDYSNMKKDSRRKLHKEMHKLANPLHLQKRMSFEDFTEKMIGKGNS